MKAAITPREITLEPSLSASIMKQEGEGGGVDGGVGGGVGGGGVHGSPIMTGTSTGLAI